MKLIDEISLSQDICNYFKAKIDKGEYEVDAVDCHAEIQAILRSQPTAYDVKAVVEQLEEKATEAGEYYNNYEDGYYEGKEDGVREAIDMVKGGAVAE